MDPLAQIIWQSNLPLKRSLGERKRAHFGTQKRGSVLGGESCKPAGLRADRFALGVDGLAGLPIRPSDFQAAYGVVELE